MFGSLITAGANLLGGLLGNKAAKKERDTQLAFAQNGIQWKVKDAEAAGVHPLFALGAPTTAYQPISSGGLPESISAMGQDLGRAADAAKSPGEKIDAYTARLQALQLERGSLENTLLKNQIINEQRVAGQPPAVGGKSIIPGQASGRDVRVGNLRISPKLSDSQAQDLENEYGEIADFIGGARFINDADKPVRDWLQSQIDAAINGYPGIATKDYDDLKRIIGWLRGKRNREPVRSSGW